MHRLHNGAQHYDWGSIEAIPHFTRSRADGRPVAEMWLGTHPLQSSSVETAEGKQVALSDVAGDLPFMVKLLAADRPLSLQVHPSRAMAVVGYAWEEAAGIPLDSPERVYKDTNHKPEMVYALTQFDSLIGFRPTAEILRVLGPIDTDLAQRVADELRADPGFPGIVRRVAGLLTELPSAEEISETVEACRALLNRGLDIRRAYRTIVEVAEHHPGDVGLIITLLLNRMTLQPGEAAYLETGVIHAHLSGLAVEVMATSDNVLRAGLTRKRVDRGGLVACLDRGMARVARVTPEYVDYDTEVFSPTGVEFALAVTQVSLADPDGVPLMASPQCLVICTGGEVELVNATGDKCALSRGDSAYLGPEDGQVLVRGLGEVAQSYLPKPTAVHSRLVDVV